MTFTILTTERLILRKLSKDDQLDILALRSDPEINKYIGRQPSKTKDDAINFINKVNENIDKHLALYWAITLKETNQFVGTICLFNLSIEKECCEIGYELLPKFHGQGIMMESAQLVIDYVFKTLKYKKIRAVSHSENQHSTRLLNKLDFVVTMEKEEENPDLIVFTLANHIQYNITDR